MNPILLLAIVLSASVISVVNAGPIAYGICQTACNAAAVSCYAASGIVMGTTGPVGWWAWLTSAATICSAAQGTCMAACTPLLVAPTP